MKTCLVLALSGLMTPAASASKIGWLDEVIQEVIRDARAGGKAVVNGGETARAGVRNAGRLFRSHEAEEGLERLVRQSDELAKAGRRVENSSEALLESRFSRLLKNDPQAVRSFSALKPAEKRLVVELGEAAQTIARRYPHDAETMVRQLGPEGMAAVKVFGDDVAEVIVKEGPESLGVLRKSGRGGWEFFTQQVLPHKKKLAAAGVLAAFMANPDRFVDYAGQVTEYAVREFAGAGITLAGAVGSGTVKGLEDSISKALASRGLDLPIFRYLGMALACVVILGSVLVLVGLPLRSIFWPMTMFVRKFGAGWRKVTHES